MCHESSCYRDMTFWLGVSQTLFETALHSSRPIAGPTGEPVAILLPSCYSVAPTSTPPLVVRLIEHIVAKQRKGPNAEYRTGPPAGISAFRVACGPQRGVGRVIGGTCRLNLRVQPWGIRLPSPPAILNDIYQKRARSPWE
jgi:hypothetical protein